LSEPIVFRRIADLRPSQLYLNSEKVEAVRKSVGKGSVAQLLPIYVKQMGGDFMITDGHHRAFVAWLNGETAVPTIIDTDEDMDWHAYEVCKDEWCKEAGILTISDLDDRIIPTDDYERLWIGRCEAAFPE
jgi:hypothetical protein